MARKKKTNTEEPLEEGKAQKRTTKKAVENKNEQPKVEEPPKFIDPPKFDEPVKQENVKQDLVMPRRTPTVAVLITMYNSVKTLDYCLASLNNQTVKPDQVVIVDDGSTDRSLDMTRRLCPDATFVEMPTNKGIYHATFEGIHAVKCDYVVRLDSDDELTPNFIKEAKELLSQYTYDIIEFPQLRLDPGETAPHDSNMNTPCDIRGVHYLIIYC